MADPSTAPTASPAQCRIAHTHHGAPSWPAGFDPSAWREHTTTLLDRWLTHEFAWATTPLARYMRAVEVGFDCAEPIRVWSPTTDEPPLELDLPRGSDSTADDDVDLSDPLAALGDMWHPIWGEVMEYWALTGTWLHPETRWQIDVKTLAEKTACLLIGCLDRTDPARPRRYDPRSGSGHPRHRCHRLRDRQLPDSGVPGRRVSPRCRDPDVRSHRRRRSRRPRVA